MKKIVGLVATLALFISATTVSLADDYPNRPITMIVPFAPGGGTDLMARMFSDKISESLGVQVVVENVPGAGGVIGTEQAIGAEPDGYTLLMGSVSTISINPSMHDLPFDPIADLEPISMVAIAPSLFAVPVDLPVSSVAEFIELAKEEGGAFNYGSAGVGTSHHLGGEFFQAMADIDMQHVPYSGTNPAVLGLIRGDVQMMIANAPALTPSVEAEHIKALAITTLERSELMPDLPTVSETPGLEGFEVVIWYGVFAPAGTPAEIVDRVNAALGEAVALPEIRERLNLAGSQAEGGSPQEFRERIVADFEKWAIVVERSGANAN